MLLPMIIRTSYGVISLILDVILKVSVLSEHQFQKIVTHFVPIVTFFKLSSLYAISFVSLNTLYLTTQHLTTLYIYDVACALRLYIMLSFTGKTTIQYNVFYLYQTMQCF